MLDLAWNLWIFNMEGMADFEQFMIGIKTCIPEAQAVEDAQLLSSLSDIQEQEAVSSTTEQRPPERQINVFLPACQVCGGISTGMHFGAATCEPCKTFFRRSIGKEDKVPPCKKSPPGYCADRNDGSKIPCTSCRYKKCLSVGMHKDGETLLESALENPGFQQGKLTCDGNIIAFWVHGVIETGPQAPSIGPSVAQTLDQNPHPYGSVDGAKKGRYSYAMKTQQTKCYRTHQALELENHVLNDQTLEDKLQLVTTAFENIFADTAYAMNNRDDFVSRANKLIEANPEKLKSDHIYSAGRNGQAPLLKGKFDVLEDVFQTLKDVPGVFLDHKGADMPLKNPVILHAMKSLWAAWAQEIEASFLSLTRFAKQIPGFSELPIEDRMILMKDVRSESMISLKHVAINKLHDVFVKYNSVSDEMILLPCSIMKTKLAGEESYEDHVKLSTKMRNLNLTIEDLAMLNVLLIIAPDRDGLVASQHITQLQEEWIPVLQHSIRKNHPGKPNVLADVLLLLPEFRQSTVNQKKFIMKAGKMLDPVMSPLLQEVLFSSSAQTDGY